jgi:RHS repeat-associated protein
VEATIFDGNGLIVDKTEPHYRGEAARHWRYVYDSLGRLKTTIEPGGRRTDFLFNGRTIVKTLNDGALVTQEFSADRRVVRVTDRSNREVRFHYDAAARIDAVILKNGSSYKLRYDAAGNRSEVVDPDRGVTRYAWNAFGDLEKTISPLGQETHFEYDELGRMVRRLSADGVTQWRYDEDRNAIGEITSVVTDSGYSEHRKYGPDLRLKALEYTVDGEMFRERFEYDGRGALTAYTYPTGLRVLYAYDRNGFVESVSAPDLGGTVWSAKAYAADGRVTRALFGSDLSSTTTLSPETGRVTRLTLEGSGRAIDDVTYQTDLEGNLKSRDDLLSHSRDAFTYDAVGQLQSWKHNDDPEETYSYDAFGNLLSQSLHGAIEYESAAKSPHRASAYRADGQVQQITYDNAGRIRHFGAAEIEYYADGRPRLVRDPREGSTVFRYTPGGAAYSERWSRGLASVDVVRLGRFERTHFVGADPLPTTGERIQYRNYLFTPSGVIGYIDSVILVFGGAKPSSAGEIWGAQSTRNIAITGDLRFVHADALGSPRVLVDRRGNVIERFSFTPWGQRVMEKDADNKKYFQAVGYSHSFAGYAPTGIGSVVRSGPRLFSPLLGRFLEPDPSQGLSAVELGSDLNPYAFARNNPLRYTDPSGLGWFDDFVNHVAGAVVGFVTGGPAGAIVGGLLGLKRAGELVNEYWRPAVAIAAGIAITVASGGTLGPVAAAMLGGAVMGGLSAGLYGGSADEIVAASLRGMIIGAVGGAAGQAVMAAHAGILTQMAVGGIAGGYSNVVQGGSFEQGFAIGALASGLAIVARTYTLDRSLAGRVLTRAAIGGTIATIEGGKFANGALTAAFTASAEGVADTVMTPNGVDYRALTEDEKERSEIMLAAKGLDPSIVKWQDVRIIDGKFFELSGAAITPYGEAYMPGNLYAADYSVVTTPWDLERQQVFFHEMVHVYQYYRGDSVAARGLFEQTVGGVGRNVYCTPGTQENEAHVISGYGCQR